MEPAYLHALPSPVIAVDRQYRIIFLNQAAEALLKLSLAQSKNRLLASLMQFGGGEEPLIQRVFGHMETISLHERTIILPHITIQGTLHITPVFINSDVSQALITIEKIESTSFHSTSEWKKEVTQAAGVMAAMLAHEVKNPLSGIRGAAQLLQAELLPEHKPLAELICIESDRIRDLLEQIDVFAINTAVETGALNIHEILQYVISVAKAGFAKNVRIIEKYDPSIPAVRGHRDLLIQLFLNLFKNAAEAGLAKSDATITLITQYRSGYRITTSQQETSIELPVMVTVEDNGPGIPDSLRNRMFEPFVSTKDQGRGLGLAMVAKIAADLGLVVEFDPHCALGARFNVMLPLVA